MNNRRISQVLCTMGILGCLATTLVAAEQAGSAQVRRIAPERAEAVPVDSVAKDLQRIVVLCATEPRSEEFKTEWARYIEAHSVTEDELDALVDDVLERAEAYRAERSPRSRRNRALASSRTTRTLMHDTAKAIINNLR